MSAVKKRFKGVKTGLSRLFDNLGRDNAVASNARSPQETNPEVALKGVEEATGACAHTDGIEAGTISRGYPRPSNMSEPGLSEIQSGKLTIVNGSWNDNAIRILEGANGFSIGYVNIHNVYGSELNEVKTISDWLSQNNWYSYHQDLTERRTENTGMWFVTGDEFQRWQRDEKARFWVTGMPGAGKTTLASLSVNYLRGSAAATPANQGSLKVAIIFAYCRYSDHCTPADIMRGLIVQFLHQIPQALGPVREVYETQRLENTKPTLSEASYLLKRLLKLVDRTQIVIDGLDELEKRDDPGLLLDELCILPAQLLIFSRPMHLFQADFPGTCLSIEAQNEDIITFVKSSIKGNRGLISLLKKAPELEQEITETICERSQGKFLIAYLQMEALKACPDVGSLRETVNTLPSGLGEMYNLTLARIDSQPKSIAAMARVALLWVSRARRRLKVKELLEAVATSYTPGTFITGEFRENKMPTWEILSSATGGLMVTDDHGEARLIHYTANDFLRSCQSSPFAEDQEIMAMVCITHCLKDLTRNLDLEDDALSSYAFQSWWHHSKLVAGELFNQRLLDFIIALCRERHLDRRRGLDGEIDQGYRVDNAFLNPEEGLRAGFNPCLMVVFLDLMHLYPRVQHLHEPSSSFQLNALHIAARAGNQRAIDIFLSQDTLPPLSTILNSPNASGRTPLMLACQYGEDGVVHSLLQCPTVDVHATDDGGHTPLHLASWKGHFRVVDLLLAHPCDPPINVNAATTDGTTALHQASRWGHFSVVEALLAHSAHSSVDVNIADASGWTAIHHATAAGRFDVIQLLIAHSSEPPVNLNAATAEGLTALHIASREGSLRIVQTLLMNTVHPSTNINTADNDGWTPLHYASLTDNQPSLDILTFLLAHPSDPPVNLNAVATDGMTPLHVASRRGNLRTVQILLAHPGISPINVDAVDTDGWTALHHASYFGHLLVIKELLDRGASLNIRTADGETALILASRNRYHENKQVKRTAEAFLLTLPDIDVDGYSYEPDP